MRNSEMMNDIFIQLEVSLFKLGLVSQEGYLAIASNGRGNVIKAWDFYDGLHNYWWDNEA